MRSECSGVPGPARRKHVHRWRDQQLWPSVCRHFPLLYLPLILFVHAPLGGFCYPQEGRSGRWIVFSQHRFDLHLSGEGPDQCIMQLHPQLFRMIVQIKRDGVRWGKEGLPGGIFTCGYLRTWRVGYRVVATGRRVGRQSGSVLRCPPLSSVVIREVDIDGQYCGGLSCLCYEASLHPLFICSSLSFQTTRVQRYMNPTFVLTKATGSNLSAKYIQSWKTFIWRM